MINDDERRKIAQRLRVLASHREVDKEMFHDAVGVWEGECLDGYDPTTVMRLADLIDCETCHLVEDDDGRTACSECGCTALCMLDASYCPECGRKVVRDGD